VNPIADGVEDLTAAWVSQALDRDIRSVSAARIGTGQTGTTYRLDLDGDGGPSTVIAKLAAGDEAARRRVAGGYRREVGFYAQLAGTLDVRTARCWYGVISDDALSFTLLLEDLAPRMPGVQLDGCSVRQADDAVRNLAGLHAPRWNDASLLDLDFLPARSDATAAFLGSAAVSAVEEFLRRYGRDLDADDTETLDASASAIRAWQVARPEPFAVIHGDYRLDNLLFPPDDDGVVVVDWQTLAVAPPARDLAYFLGTSLRTEDRRAAEDRLVAAYHAELVTRGVLGYGIDRCFDDYRLGQLQGPMITLIGAAFSTAERTDAADAMFLAMARRTCAAVRDLGSLEMV